MTPTLLMAISPARSSSFEPGALCGPQPQSSGVTGGIAVGAVVVPVVAGASCAVLSLVGAGVARSGKVCAEGSGVLTSAVATAGCGGRGRGNGVRGGTTAAARTGAA